METQPFEITFDNAFDLALGIYHFKPNSYSETGSPGEEVITSLDWGSVNPFGKEIQEAPPPDTPKVLALIELNSQPYVKILNGQLAIEYKPALDELLVEIGGKLREETEQGGDRGNRYEYTLYRLRRHCFRESDQPR